MYQLLIDQLTGVPVSSVLRLADSAYIPADPGNADYQEYLLWLEAGGTPIPADPVAGVQHG